MIVVKHPTNFNEKPKIGKPLVERKGDILLFLSSLIFAVVSLLVKLASTNTSGIFIASWRFIVGAVMTVFALKILKISIKIEKKSEWFLRGLFGSIAMVCFYLSIQHSSLSRAALLCNTSPVFVAIFGYLIFKEKLRLENIVSLLFCFTGVVVIFYERGSYSLMGDILGLLSGVFSGMAIHYVKRSSMRNHALLVYLSPCLFGLFFIPLTFSGYHDITVNNFLLVIIIGILTAIAQFFMTSGYRYVSATRGSILSYLQIPLTILLGAVFVQDPFPAGFLIGILLVSAGLLVNMIRLRSGIGSMIKVGMSSISELLHK